MRMRCRVLASGFRLAFLLAGLAAVLLVPAWVAILIYGAPFASGWPPTLWHGHEMLFGFVGAAIAGFLLTAVPSWTGRRGFGGAPLVVLGALWLGARLLNATAAAWPAALVLAVDVGFLVALALLFAPPLIRERNRNTPMLLVLALLAACNVAFHRALGRHDPPAASHALLIAIDITLVLVTIVGGRLIPAYTAAVLREAGGGQRVRTRPGLGMAAIAVMAAVALVDLRWPGSRAAALLAGSAALLQFLRLLQWRTLATLSEPMVWVLHAAYAWLPLGLALKCAALARGWAASAFWLHALTVGALATMILGVMSRVALSHTGRLQRCGPATTAAYALLLLAALLRVFGLALPGIDYASVIVLSATFWSAAFALFLVVYGPILWLPRSDGRAG
jgi:uncharacterized protein involved in response to NO